MNFFSSTVKGPDIMDMKTTFENLQAVLSGPDYIDGMDQATTVAMVGSVYKYVIGKSNSAIHMPAPASVPDDRHRVMWPEGIKVKTRRTSVSSTGSGHHSRRTHTYALNPNVTTPRAMSRASSVTSGSQYSSRYVGIAEEEDDEPLPPRRNPPPRGQPQRQDSRRYDDEPQGIPLRPRHEPVRGTGTNRVSNAAMKPTPSMERFMRNEPDQEEEEEEVVHAPRPPRRTAARKSRFADEEE